jgi:hypothetical protein
MAWTKFAGQTQTAYAAIAIPAQKRSGLVMSATEVTNSNIPVSKITCGAKGTHEGVIDNSSSGTARWATPTAT